MKRFISLILIAVLTLSLAACSKPDIGEAENDDTTTQAGIDISGQEDSDEDVTGDENVTDTAINYTPLPETITADLFKVNWIDTEITPSKLDADGVYLDKYTENWDQTFLFYEMGNYRYRFLKNSNPNTDVDYWLSAISIFETNREEGQVGPLGICIGDKEEEIVRMYPDTFNDKDIEVNSEGNYVLHAWTDIEHNSVRFIPEE